MNSSLENMVVLVTGASKGIGRALALGCARCGADVVVNYLSDRQGAESVVAEIESIGRRAVAIGADIGSVDEIDRLFAEARQAFPVLHVLINNAALTGWGPALETTEAKWDAVMNTNLKGVFFCSVAAARWMREVSVSGSIVNVSTNCAALGVKNLVAYATSKAGIHGLTRQLAIELAPDGIRVNTFAPGPTNVDRNIDDDPDYRRVWGTVVPLGRTAEPEEMVGPALFLATPASSFVTGQVLYVDGGWSAAGNIPSSNLERASRRNIR
jgi:NAD(P)-dependent dehydrogenase (short-subunit alcohol dehydrogenase family)